jgi:hypothetical protein
MGIMPRRGRGKLDLNLTIVIKIAAVGGGLLGAFNVVLGYLAGGVGMAVAVLGLNLAYALAFVLSLVPIVGVVLQGVVAYWLTGVVGRYARVPGLIIAFSYWGWIIAGIVVNATVDFVLFLMLVLLGRLRVG